MQFSTETLVALSVAVLIILLVVKRLMRPKIDLKVSKISPVFMVYQQVRCTLPDTLEKICELEELLSKVNNGKDYKFEPTIRMFYEKNFSKNIPTKIIIGKVIRADDIKRLKIPVDKNNSIKSGGFEFGPVVELKYPVKTLKDLSVTSGKYAITIERWFKTEHKKRYGPLVEINYNNNITFFGLLTPGKGILQ